MGHLRQPAGPALKVRVRFDCSRSERVSNVGFGPLEPVNDERDAYHQACALANVAGWINKLALDELVEQELAKRGGTGGDLRARLDAIFADTLGAAYETAEVDKDRLLNRMVEILSQGKEAQP
jgi:hypothetical protein